MSANPEQCEIEMSLGGRNYHLKFNNRTVAIIEKAWGYGHTYLFSNFQKLVGVDMIATAIHGAMQWKDCPPHHRRMTVEGVITAMDMTNFEAVYVLPVAEALGNWRGINRDAKDVPEDEKAEETKPGDPG